MFFSEAESTTASGQSRWGAVQPATLASGIMWMSQRRDHPRAMVALRRGPALHNLSSLKLHFLQAMRSLCGDGKHTFIIIEEHSVHQTWQKRMQGVCREVSKCTQPHSRSVFPERLGMSTCTCLGWPAASSPSSTHLVLSQPCERGTKVSFCKYNCQNKVCKIMR